MRSPYERFVDSHLTGVTAAAGAGAGALATSRMSGTSLTWGRCPQHQPSCFSPQTSRVPDGRRRCSQAAQEARSTAKRQAPAQTLPGHKRSRAEHTRCRAAATLERTRAVEQVQGLPELEGWRTTQKEQEQWVRPLCFSICLGC